MIDPLVSLAFAMHSNKGVYALLVGSGISRAAAIPTGWDIILDLTRKVAQTMGEDPEPDPEVWYREKFGEEPNYSRLLGEVAKTPSERQQLLKAYFEPSDEDREQGGKQPTLAHQAIAELVRSGHVRVIITTNFDRLFEQSLEAAGVSHTVISTPHAVDGAMPLTHSPCTIIKVHGDYLDTRIKNTPEELEKYDPRMNALLDRVLDEFGLIVCGWSADWDFALKDTFHSCKSRRFTTYWAALGTPGQQAQDLIQLRGAQVIPITGADQFFTELAGKVAALEEFAQPHPLSARMAVASLKRYLTDSKHRIRLEDLVTSETERLVAELTEEHFSAQVPVTEAEFVSRVRQYETLTETLRDLLIAGCYWGEDQHRKLWTRCVERIANQRGSQSGNDVWLKLRWYPAVILFYAAGLACLANDRYDMLSSLFLHAKVVEYNHEMPLAERLYAASLHAGGQDAWVWVVGGKKYTPASDHLFSLLRQPLHSFLPDDLVYQQCFDRFEYLLALTYADLCRERAFRSWVPAGAFVWRDQWNPQLGVQSRIDREAEAEGTQWAPLQAGLFGGSQERFRSARDWAQVFLQRLSWG